MTLIPVMAPMLQNIQWPLWSDSLIPEEISLNANSHCTDRGRPTLTVTRFARHFSDILIPIQHVQWTKTSSVRFQHTLTGEKLIQQNPTMSVGICRCELAFMVLFYLVNQKHLWISWSSLFKMIFLICYLLCWNLNRINGTISESESLNSMQFPSQMDILCMIFQNKLLKSCCCLFRISFPIFLIYGSFGYQG